MNRAKNSGVLCYPRVVVYSCSKCTVISVNRFADYVTDLKAILIGNALINFIDRIGCQIFRDRHEKQETLEKESSFQFNKVGSVVKNQLIWYIALMVFCSYGLYSTSYYYTTFLTTVKGLSPNIGAQLSLI
ncbi:hypothetical protein [Schnuerera ultunensis]|uniref:Uncharacterized protein n=1 Tax=[Clostridium] ultunense Esp TaxID=1288971 RepID=A0A1M4PQC3_9FIRM|nr:hypothetical protein [Schnuerera ultunensis]SHD77682.1 protein of unknown function [[Clostridium] ultunense Esp]